MSIRCTKIPLLLAAAALLASGCATAPQAEIQGRAAAVRVYEMDPFVGQPYDIVGRLWGDSWRSAYRVPTHPTKDAAIASLQAEAARLNADALVSVSCLDQHGSTWSASNDSAFFCYGVAVRLRQRPS
jgi:uncharacterized protein YbjQ (UPF0145 family)